MFSMTNFALEEIAPEEITSNSLPPENISKGLKKSILKSFSCTGLFFASPVSLI